MKVLVADKFPEIYVNQIKDLGLEVIYQPKLGENDLPEAAKEVDILVVRSTNVIAETINKSETLNLIVRAGAGVNNIDIAAANQKGVYVANCPGKNSIAVAELAIGFMIALDRRIANNVMDFKKGVWNKAEYSKAEGLFGKTLALIGVGNIGKEVAKRAIALGMNVYGKDISRIEGVPVKDFSEMDKLLPLTDIISIHLPLNKETKNLFNKEIFDYLKPGAILINTSRAEIIDEEALIEAVKTKKLRVGLDVFKDEPEGKDGTVKSPLQELENVYVTHHIGASTEQAQNAVAEETVNIIRDFLGSGVIAHWVNRAKKIEAHYQLVVKHYDRPGVLAAVFDILKDGNINIEEVENVIFDGGIAASCTMKLNQAATPNMLEAIRKNDNVLNISHIEI
ncbi:MAG: NAD(P)-binding domain-containing protein [Ignavibacteriales bacterium]|nr:NAD(P)-binding domain-containing protein [Ignavibacteriales bacterium]